MREATGVRPTPRAIEMLDDVTAAIAALPQFLTALATVAASDVLATVPRGLAAAYVPMFELSVYDVPVAMPPRYEMVALKGPLTARDPAVNWLIDNLAGM